VWRLEYPTAARPGDTLRVAAKVGKATAVKSERVPGQPTTSSGSSTPTTLLVLLALVLGGSIVLFTVLKIRSSDAFRRWERRLRTDRN
jgi:hypothetical protein